MDVMHSFGEFCVAEKLKVFNQEEREKSESSNQIKELDLEQLKTKRKI
jgi:hypothetical protein